MGQKVNPLSFRLPITNRWKSKSFLPKFNYSQLLHQDLQVQKYILGTLHTFKLICNHCVIKRVKDFVYISIYFYKPVLKQISNKNIKLLLFKKTKAKKTGRTNRRTKKINKSLVSKSPHLFSLSKFMSQSLSRIFSSSKVSLRFIPLNSLTSKRHVRSITFITRFFRFVNSVSYLFLVETAFSTKNAQLLAKFLSLNLYLHIRNVRFFLRFVDRLLTFFMKQYSFKGIKLSIKGRLNGARRARTVVIQKGKVPLNTISARIDYGFANSMTIYSTCSVKVWFYF